jgi:hypothetical protein
MRNQLFRRAWQLVAALTLTVPIALAVVPNIELPGGRLVIAPEGVTSERIYLASLVLGLIAIVFAWRPTRFLVTLIHEMGHAQTASLVGGHPLRITMAMDSSGLATTQLYDSSRVRRSLVYLAGCAAPGIAAVSGAAAIAVDNAYPWILFTAVLVSITLLGLARSVTVIGVCLLIVIGTGCIAYWVPWAAPGVAGVLVVVWALGGVRCAREQFRWIGRGTTDSGLVQQTLGIPARVVAAGQLVLAVGLVFGAAAFVPR